MGWLMGRTEDRLAHRKDKGQAGSWGGLGQAGWLTERIGDRLAHGEDRGQAGWLMGRTGDKLAHGEDRRTKAVRLNPESCGLQEAPKMHLSAQPEGPAALEMLSVNLPHGPGKAWVGCSRDRCQWLVDPAHLTSGTVEPTAGEPHAGLPMEVTREHGVPRGKIGGWVARPVELTNHPHELYTIMRYKKSVRKNSLISFINFEREREGDRESQASSTLTEQSRTWGPNS